MASTVPGRGVVTSAAAAATPVCTAASKDEVSGAPQAGPQVREELCLDSCAGLQSMFVDDRLGVAWINDQRADAGGRLHTHRAQRDPLPPGSPDDRAPGVIAADHTDNGGILAERTHRAGDVQTLSARQGDGALRTMNAPRGKAGDHDHPVKTEVGTEDQDHDGDARPWK